MPTPTLHNPNDPNGNGTPPSQPNGQAPKRTGFTNDPGYTGHHGLNAGQYTDDTVGQGYNGHEVLQSEEDALDDRGQTRAEYGGQYGLANNIATQYYQQGDKYTGRHIGEEFSSPYRQRQGNAGDRGALTNALAMQQDAMTGRTPSAAEINQSVGISDTLANQYASGASGGSIGLAQAQNVGTRANLGNIQQGIAGREAETNAATGAYMQGLVGLNRGDVQGLSIDQQRELQQAALNQKMHLGSEMLGNQVLEDQLQADTSGYNIMYSGERGALTAAQIANAQIARDNFNAALGAGAGLASAYMQSGGFGDSGPQSSPPTEADLENPYYQG